MSRLDIGSMDQGELKGLMEDLSQPKFRAKQIFEWLHKKHAASFDAMSNLPLSLRTRLDEMCYIGYPKELLRRTTSDTAKFLLELFDKNTIEMVLMRHNYGNSLCISTQVGCAMGCAFCASTIGGRVRNLTAYEMLSQIYLAEDLSHSRVDSVVLMGMGEPLDNMDNVLRFLKLLGDPSGKCMSQRHVSLSTCGLADRIDELAQHRLQLTLSVSLHAATDEQRDRLMPVNRRYPLSRLMKSCCDYFDMTGRRISYEYSLINGENDTPEDARRLSALLRGQTCHVNLILINPVEGKSFSPPQRAAAERFRDIIESNRIPCTIRRSFGAEIDAACGQLRRKNAQKG